MTVALARAIQPGWHCLDVGANFGYYSVLMAKAVGPEGRVPNSLLVEGCLPDTLRLNGAAEIVEFSRQAVAAAVVEGVAFRVKENDRGTSRLSGPAGTDTGLLAPRQLMNSLEHGSGST